MTIQTIYSFTTLVCLVVLSSCGNVSEDNSTIFRYNEPDGISTLDPARMSYRSSMWVGAQIFQGLVDADTLCRPIPSLAQSWSVSSDGKIWTFRLRKGVFFHKNDCFGREQTRQCTAHDVRYSFERICDARTASTGFWVFRNTLEGALTYFQATKRNDVQEIAKGISGIRVLNDSTLELHLIRPFAPFLSLLTSAYCYIVPKEAVEKYGKDFAKNPIGTGPFRFVSWKTDVELILAKNELFYAQDEHGHQLPYLSGVHISFLRDTKSEFLQFRQGNFDFLSAIEPTFAPAVLTPQGTLRTEFSQFRLLQSAANTIEYYGILLDTAFSAAKSTPLATQKYLRQAINYAIDREAIVRTIANGRGIPATNGILPPSMPGFSSDVKGYTYNPVRARELLALAGFPDGKGLPKITLQLGQNERTAAVAEAVQEQLSEIGIALEIRQVDFPQHLEMVRSGKLPFWRTSWIGDYADPENFLALFTTSSFAPNGPNTTHFASHEIDSLYEYALNPLLPESQRRITYNTMERIILDEAPWIPLYYGIVQRIIQPNIIGFSADGLDRLRLLTVRKSKTTNAQDLR